MNGGGDGKAQVDARRAKGSDARINSSGFDP